MYPSSLDAELSLIQQRSSTKPDILGPRDTPAPESGVIADIELSLVAKIRIFHFESYNDISEEAKMTARWIRIEDFEISGGT